MNLKLIFSLFFVICLFASCSEKEESLPEGTHRVIVQEKMDASGYSYFNVKEGEAEYWIAVPEMPAKIGDTLYYTRSTEMKKFLSKTLNRTFESILFVEDISTQLTKAVPGDMQHPKIENAKVDSLKIEPLADGVTIGKIYSDKSSLNGKTVKVRGKVTKFNPEIMDKNWIHLQDGTGGENSYDLMVTSAELVNVGDVIVIEGILAVDKDFGSGYKYEVIVENAKIIKEK